MAAALAGANLEDCPMGYKLDNSHLCAKDDQQDACMGDGGGKFGFSWNNWHFTASSHLFLALQHMTCLAKHYKEQMVFLQITFLQNL